MLKFWKDSIVWTSWNWSSSVATVKTVMSFHGMSLVWSPVSSLRHYLTRVVPGWWHALLSRIWLQLKVWFQLLELCRSCLPNMMPEVVKNPEPAHSLCIVHGLVLRLQSTENIYWWIRCRITSLVFEKIFKYQFGNWFPIALQLLFLFILQCSKQTDVVITMRAKKKNNFKIKMTALT